MVTKLAVAGLELLHENGTDASVEAVEGNDSAFELEFVIEAEAQLEDAHAQDIVVQFQPAFAGENVLEDKSDDLLQHGLMDSVPEAGH